MGVLCLSFCVNSNVFWGSFRLKQNMERTRLFLRTACCFPKSDHWHSSLAAAKICSPGAMWTGFKAGLTWCCYFKVENLCSAGVFLRGDLYTSACFSWLEPHPCTADRDWIICQSFLLWSSLLLTTFLESITCSVFGRKPIWEIWSSLIWKEKLKLSFYWDVVVQIYTFWFWEGMIDNPRHPSLVFLSLLEVLCCAVYNCMWTEGS